MSKPNSGKTLHQGLVRDVDAAAYTGSTAAAAASTTRKSRKVAKQSQQESTRHTRTQTARAAPVPSRRRDQPIAYSKVAEAEYHPLLVPSYSANGGTSWFDSRSLVKRPSRR
jgi:hypothetical protein